MNDKSIYKIINRELFKVNSMLRKQLDIAREGLKAINDSVETNIAQKTLDEIDNIKPE